MSPLHRIVDYLKANEYENTLKKYKEREVKTITVTGRGVP
jgi:hypothetical protein